MTTDPPDSVNETLAQTSAPHWVAAAGKPAPGPPARDPEAAPQMPVGTIVATTNAFAEETRALLRRRLLVTHSAVGIVTAVITAMGLLGIPVLPSEAGLGRWVVGLPMLMFGQSVAGWVFLARQPKATLGALRFVEMTHFGGLAIAAGLARYMALSTPPADSLDPRYPLLLYRFDAVLTNYPVVFAVILYGVLIPNTRRRSLAVATALCLVPMSATIPAGKVNPALFPTLPTLIPVTLLPLFMAMVVAVFCASRATSLRREVFEARREANEVGPYTLGRLLGKGGMGEVFMAEHRLLKRPCAIKFIRAELAANPSNAARFEREVRAVTGLSHFNTVRVYDYGRADDGAFYYVMEYLDGQAIDALVARVGPLAPARVVFLLRQLCGALAEAHAAGLVHRDLKPGNILVATLGGQHDVAKLLDFGLVQDMATLDSGERLTAAGMVIGTPAYMCPEQASGEAGIDARGDVYSLGAVAFFALAGRAPFEAVTVGQFLTAHLTQIPPNLTTLRADIPADLAAVVAKCLAKAPGDRFQSVAALEAALAACECGPKWDCTRAATWWAENPKS